MSATFQLLIATVDKTSICAPESLRYSSRLGSVGQATFTLKTPTGAPYIPADDAAVEIKIGGTTRWAGEVAEVEVTTLKPTDGATVTVTAHDYNSLAKRVLVNTIFPAQSLKSTLEDLTDPGGVLASVSVTLDAAQAAGPTLDIITAPWWTVETLLNHLSTVTGYVWWINASKELRMWAIGDIASGITLDATNTNILSVSWRKHRLDYRNSQWVVYGPSEVRTVTDTWTGDSTTRSWTLRYNTNTPIPTPPSTVTVCSTGATILPVGIFGSTADAALQFWYASSDTTIKQSTGFSVLTSTSTLAATYGSQFPNALNVQDSTEIAAHGLWVRADQNESIVDYDEADAWADALIRSNLTRTKMPAVVTSEVAIGPGQTITVDLSSIDLGATTCAIQAIEASLTPAGAGVEPFVSLDLTGGAETQATSVELWRRIITGDSAGGSALGSGGGGGTSGTSTFTGVMHAHLGGSRTQDYLTASFVPIAEYQVFSCSVSGDYSFRCEVKTRNASTTVQVRLYDLTAAAAAVTLTASASTTWAEVTGAAALVAGHRYRAEVTGSDAVYGVSVGQATVEV